MAKQSLSRKIEDVSLSRKTEDVSSRYFPNESIANNIVPAVEDCIYSPFYCEENVWHLCDYVRSNNTSELSKCFAVFISNNAKCVPLWKQKAGHESDKLVIWDYHVIFLNVSDDGCFVFDLDTELPFPTYFHNYCKETFRTDHILPPENYRSFRVIPAAMYLQKFASDRRHMKLPNGKWMQQPPNTPHISCAESLHNLNDFISMKQEKGYGVVFRLEEFVKKFYKKH